MDDMLSAEHEKLLRDYAAGANSRARERRSAWIKATFPTSRV